MRIIIINWAPSLVFETRCCTVNDFKYLGSWLSDSTKDFRVREALAWKAWTRLVKIWKSKLFNRAMKLKLFLACVESTQLYNAVTWTMADTLAKALDGRYLEGQGD